MSHIEILTAVASMYRDPIYLEIGVGDGHCFERVAGVCSFSVGVDIIENPYGEGTNQRIMEQICSVPNRDFYDCGSDNFFADWGESGKFDLIFIDGSHWEEQVWKDLYNSLLVLSPIGTIVMHDTWANSADEAAQGSDTAYKVAMALEGDDDYQAFTLPVRPGLTFVRRNTPRSYA